MVANWDAGDGAGVWFGRRSWAARHGWWGDCICGLIMVWCMDMGINFVDEWDARMAWVSAFLWLGQQEIVTRLGWRGITELGASWELSWGPVESAYLVWVAVT